MKQEIIATGRRLFKQGLIHALSGNISLRLGDQSILITAAGVSKGALSADDILRIDAEGKPLGQPLRQPSSETELHLALYKALPHIRGIVHAHPPYATALATSGQELNWQLLEESRLFLGPVPLLPPLAAGSPELAWSVLQALFGKQEAKALLLAGHGAVSWGENLEIARERMEILEHTARVMLYTRLFSG